ncbi:MAG: carboxypeptidase-like regulatory domain-containing protein [Flavobacteriaceae bacterium]
MKKLLLFALLLGSLSAFSQGTVTGNVTDSDLGGPLPGANVLESGTANGTVTDFDGNFTLSVSANAGTIEISYLGYVKKTVKFTLSNGTVNLGTVALEADANTLAEVVIVGTGVIDLAEDRKTPVAVSTITAQEIQDKVSGNVEITQALKATPSVNVSGDSGFGDSQLYLRGFDQSNTAVLLNGQPVNGMEDGNVYWSNWAGISDIASAIQVQRGLGASKLAISSVGGTVNILMKAADRKEGGFARFLGANDSYFKGTAAYNTGMSDSGWAFSVLLDYWQAHRKWSKGTYGQGQNYFFAVGYKPNDTHSFNFLLTGAPQLHGQKWSQSKEQIAEDPKFNQHWGYNTVDGDMGNISSERQNYYHKPVLNLNWDWTMSESSELSTVLYASYGRGGGTGDRGNGRIRTEDGQIDYAAIYEANTAIGIGNDFDNPDGRGYIRRSSVNNHQWFGAVSNFNHDFSDAFSLNVGVDARKYTGDHFRQVANFYGLTGWSNDRPDDAIVTTAFDANPWASLSDFASEGERINYDYSEDINYLGGFGQLEYATDSFSIFAQGAYSTQSYQREDRFAEITSDKVNRTGYNIKGGISYTIAEDHTIFMNGGYYSRQPYLDNIFSFRVNNADIITPEVENEIIRSVEGGYHFSTSGFRANFNAYITDWSNRTTTNLGRNDNGTPKDDSDDFDETIFQRGIRQYHTGAEFDFSWRTTNWLTLNGYMSGGSWVYKGKVSEQRYNSDTQEILSETEGVDLSGIRVTTAPQFTTGLSAKARILTGLSIDGTINYRANHYDQFEAYQNGEVAKLNNYSITDLGLTYKFNLGGSNDLTFRANVFNVFDHIGLSNADNFGYFTENGRTYNGSLRYSF